MWHSRVDRQGSVNNWFRMVHRGWLMVDRLRMVDHWFWMVNRFRMVVPMMVMVFHHLQSQLFHVGFVKGQPKHHLHAERVANKL